MSKNNKNKKPEVKEEVKAEVAMESAPEAKDVEPKVSLKALVEETQAAVEAIPAGVREVDLAKVDAIAHLQRAESLLVFIEKALAPKKK